MSKFADSVYERSKLDDNNIVGSEIRQAIGEMQRERDEARVELDRVKVALAARDGIEPKLDGRTAAEWRKLFFDTDARLDNFGTFHTNVDHVLRMEVARLKAELDRVKAALEATIARARLMVETSWQELFDVLDCLPQAAPPRVASEADVERVARAIREIDGDEGMHWDYWLPEARAALAAMGYTLPLAAKEINGTVGEVWCSACGMPRAQCTTPTRRTL